MKTLALGALAICLLPLAPASAVSLYSNGPMNGNVYAWANDNFAVTDSFTVSAARTIASFDFVEWTNPGQTVPTVNWSIGTTPGASDIGSGTGYSVTNVYDFTNYMYDVSTDTVTGLNVALPAAGTYWFTLSHAFATDESTGGNGFWDENDGPSTAFQGSSSLANGGILKSCPDRQPTCTGSETFDLYDTLDGAAVPEPGGLALMGCAFLALVAALRRRRERLRAGVTKVVRATVCGWDGLLPRHSAYLPPADDDSRIQYRRMLTNF